MVQLFVVKGISSSTPCVMILIVVQLNTLFKLMECVPTLGSHLYFIN